MGDEIPKWPAQKPAPEPPPDRTSWAQRASAEYWSGVTDPIGRLKHLEARYARLDPANIEAFRQELTAAIRNAEPAAILAEPRVVTMVRSVYGERGVTRLRDRAAGVSHA
jgi:TPP-dependent pyruvate/acetoin dehydrogenase alpha subunit